MKTVLIATMWLQGSPFIATQAVDSMDACLRLSEALVRSVKAQAQPNLTSPHRHLNEAGSAEEAGRVLRTGTIGREIARVQCVAVP